MKIETTRDEFFISTATDDTEMGMQTNAYVYDLLSNGLYSDKVSAVIREVCCNAVDSHTEAGKSDTPIRVTLPTPYHQFFEVEDFGVGMSEDTARNVFGSYFNSSKTDTNDTTGAFGLGSKTPFIMNDAFTARVRFNGEETVYSLFKKDGRPRISASSRTETSECNGVKITVPVSPTHCKEFIEKANNIFPFFKVFPDIVENGVQDKINHVTVKTVPNELVAYENAECTFRTPSILAVMGGVAYPVYSSDAPEVSRLRELLNNDLHMVFPSISQYKDIKVVEFPVGDLSVTPSRESLAYTPLTLASLERVLTDIYERRLTEIQDSGKNDQSCVGKVDSITNFLYNNDEHNVHRFLAVGRRYADLPDISNIFKRYMFSRWVGKGNKSPQAIAFMHQATKRVDVRDPVLWETIWAMLVSTPTSKPLSEALRSLKVLTDNVRITFVHTESRKINTAGLIKYCQSLATSHKPTEKPPAIVIAVPHRLTDARKAILTKAVLRIFGCPEENVVFSLFTRDKTPRDEVNSGVSIEGLRGRCFRHNFEVSPVFSGEIERLWGDKGVTNAVLYTTCSYEEYKQDIANDPYSRGGSWFGDVDSWSHVGKVYLLRALLGHQIEVVIKHRNNARAIDDLNIRCLDDVYDEYVKGHETEAFTAWCTRNYISFGELTRSSEIRMLLRAGEPDMCAHYNQINTIIQKYGVDDLIEWRNTLVTSRSHQLPDLGWLKADYIDPNIYNDLDQISDLATEIEKIDKKSYKFLSPFHSFERGDYAEQLMSRAFKNAN